MARTRLDPHDTEVWTVRLTREQSDGIRTLARDADRPFTSQIRHIVREYLSHAGTRPGAAAAREEHS